MKAILSVLVLRKGEIYLRRKANVSQSIVRVREYQQFEVW